MNLRQLQTELAPWVARNFGAVPWQMPLMGVSEEVGELNHALLKQWQGVRGTAAEHEAAAKDAVGDIVVFLANLCIQRGWDFGAIVEETWAKVSRRDYRSDSGLVGSDE